MIQPQDYILHVILFLKICLQVQGKGDVLSSFDGFFDLKEQALLRDDCTQLVGMYYILRCILCWSWMSVYLNFMLIYFWHI